MSLLMSILLVFIYSFNAYSNSGEVKGLQGISGSLQSPFLSTWCDNNSTKVSISADMKLDFEQDGYEKIQYDWTLHSEQLIEYGKEYPRYIYFDSQSSELLLVSDLNRFIRSCPTLKDCAKVDLTGLYPLQKCDE